MTDLTDKLIECIDAQMMAINHPLTFKVPSSNKLNLLFTGDFVKVSVGAERFWCQIITLENNAIVARVDNDLINTGEHGISYNDVIKFEKRHIYQILDENENQSYN